MATIPIKLRREIIEKLDYLVKVGRYPNRSAAIREILEEKLESENYIFKDFRINHDLIEEILRKLLSKRDLEINLKSKSSATDIVSEGRER